MADISELNSMQKFDYFLKVLDFYHVERCEYEECPQWLSRNQFEISLCAKYCSAM